MGEVITSSRILNLGKHGERSLRSEPESVAISNRDPACRRQRQVTNRATTVQMILSTRHKLKAAAPLDQKLSADRGKGSR